MTPIEKSDIISGFSRPERAPRTVAYRLTDSTNKQALAFAASERPTEPVLFIASEQTAGRGRLGRSFSSPEGGIYMTVLTPAPEGGDLVALTTYAVTAVCRALEELTPLSPRIKWVNDVYIGERKLSGILAQGAVDPEDGRITHIAMGIGLNVRGKELAPEIEDIATTLEREGCSIERAALASRIAEIYLSDIDKAGSPEVIEEYRRRSMLIGAQITVIKPNESYPARVLGIGDACELIIEREDGEREHLSTGDVSVRKKK